MLPGPMYLPPFLTRAARQKRCCNGRILARISVLVKALAKRVNIMTSTDLGADILRLCSHRHNLPLEELYGSFPTVDRTHLGEMVHELAMGGLLVANVSRSALIDGPSIIVNAISRTSLVGEAWLRQLGDEPPVTVH